MEHKIGIDLTVSSTKPCKKLYTFYFETFRIILNPSPSSVKKTEVEDGLRIDQVTLLTQDIEDYVSAGAVYVDPTAAYDTVWHRTAASPASCCDAYLTDTHSPHDTIKTFCLTVFNDHASHCSGSCFFGYNSPPAAARELFKPSTDSASLVVPSQKPNFSVLGLGFFWGSVTCGGVFAFLRPTLPGLGRLSNGPIFSPKYLYETRLSYESVEPLIGFLAYLDQNLCHKNQKVVENSTPKKGKQNRITPLLDMAITRC